MTVDDTLAARLAGHQMFDGYTNDGCECGEPIGYEYEDLAAHQADVALAWFEEHTTEETMKVPCISPAGHEWGELDRCLWCGRSASRINVRRTVTDREDAE